MSKSNRIRHTVVRDLNRIAREMSACAVLLETLSPLNAEQMKNAVDMIRDWVGEINAIEHMRRLDELEKPYIHFCEDNGYTPFENEVIKQISHIVSPDLAKPISTIVAGLHEKYRLYKDSAHPKSPEGVMHEER